MKTLHLVSWFLALMPLRGQEQMPALTHGPLRGHVDGSSMHVWARANGPGRYSLRCQSLAEAKAIDVEALADPAHDCTLHFVVDGLEPGQAYDVEIRAGETVVGRSVGLPWTTALPDHSSAAVVAFGSCSNDKALPEQPIWGRILARAPHALVLLGDTPYIDLGTTEGRQRRHRDFLAFPPVRATLAAIPTWTTWDDHDYATNDTFGAAAGSETARAVFVDYHAQKGYGDGQSGIWTSFRRGPIEVFLLDARSAADRGESVLAPGQRTLLGPAQIAWLQQGLRTSTASIKVLACGMVWNDAVRPNKKDCWGNWLPERDALFAWLGKQRIEGVVLVSGDVHRSRVILHPTKAVVGYDLPELVTSPLAQNVLESNAIPTPGLVFDAGEPQSCLFLEAVQGPLGPTLRVVFQAGDGREFHVREFAPVALRGADAAVTYRRIAGDLMVVFGPELAPLPVDWRLELGVDADAAVGPKWRVAVAQAAAQLGAWQSIVGVDRCRFARVSTHALRTEFDQEIAAPLYRLQSLGVAAALQAIADRQPAVVENSVRAALALARHLQQEPSLLAWWTAQQIELQVVALIDRAGPIGAEVVGRLRGLVAEHLARRPGVEVLHRAVRSECMHLFEARIAELRLGDDRGAALARQSGAAVRTAYLACMEPELAAFEALPAGAEAVGLAAVVDCRNGRIAALAARMRQISALHERVAKGPEPAVAADLALWLASHWQHDLAELHRRESDGLVRLASASR